MTSRALADWLLKTRIRAGGVGVGCQKFLFLAAAGADSALLPQTAMTSTAELVKFLIGMRKLATWECCGYRWELIALGGLNPRQQFSPLCPACGARGERMGTMRADYSGKRTFHQFSKG